MLDTITDNYHRIISADFIYSFIFLAFLLYHSIISKYITDMNYNRNITTADYAV